MRYIRSSTGRDNAIVIRRTSKILLEIMGIAIAGAIVLVLLAAWRLSSGTISLDFIAPYIEEDLAAPDDPYFFKLGEVAVTWGGWSHALTLQADGVKLYRRDGTLITSLPVVEIGLSARALLVGDIAPTSLFLIDPKLRLRRDADGRISLGLDDTPDLTSGDAAETVKTFVLGLAAEPNRDRPSGYLKDLRIINGDISVIDDQFDKVWHVPDATIVLKRDRIGLRLDVEFELNFDSDVTTVHASGIYNRNLATAVLDTEISNFLPRHIAGRINTLDFLDKVDAAFDGEFSFTVDIDGKVLDAGFNVVSGPGRFLSDGLYPEGLAVESLQAIGRVSENLDGLEIDNLLIDLGGPAVVVAGSISNLRTAPTITGDIAMSDVPVNDFDRLWPISVGEGAREWVTENISDGTVAEIRATAKLHAADATLTDVVVDRLDGTMKFHGATVEYLRPMPAVRQVSGTTKFNTERFDIFIQGGAVGDLEVASGRITLKNFDQPPEAATIDLMVTGPVDQALTLIDSQPLGYAGKLGIDPADVGGWANIGVHLAFPLVRSLTLDELNPKAEARISSLKWKRAFKELDVEDGDLSVEVDEARMIADGTVTIAARPIALTWRENFGDADYVTEVEASGTFADPTMPKIVPKIADLLSGPVDAEIGYRIRGDGWATLDATGDISAATLTAPYLDWEKPAGIPGRATLQLSLKDDRAVELTTFQLLTDDVRLRGGATFTAAGDDIDVATIDEFSAGLTTLSGSIALAADGSKGIALVGESLDLTDRFGEWFSDEEDDDVVEAQGAEEPGAALDIDAKIGRVYLDSAEHRYAEDVTLRLRRRDDSIQSASLEMKVPGRNQTFGLSVEPTGNIRYVSALTEDAGDLFRLLGIVDTVKGGRLILTGQFDDATDDRILTAALKVTDYRVIDAPVLARILTLASFTGIVDELNGTGISFDRLEADIEMIGDAVTIANGRAHGSALGLTMGGTYDNGADILDLEGTIVPAYFFNSILGNIPLIGTILVGEEGSGVFAGAYSVTGPRDNPRVTVNPLTALLPGVLRKIMTGAGGGASAENPVYPYNDEKPILFK